MYVTAVTQQRRAAWERVLGDSELPVCGPARWQCLQGGEALAYDLDVSRLHDQQLARLGRHIASQSAGDPAEVAVALARGAVKVPIPAAGVQPVEDAGARKATYLRR
jgi:hypothetical protein